MIASLIERVSRKFTRKPTPDRCPECGHEVQQMFCDVCGYDLVRQTRDKAFHRPVV
jgi:rRNA maturation endonuclease Nob1